MPQPLLFPLNRISQTDIPALQFALRAVPLLQPAFMQQRPRSIGGRLAPKVPVNFPWDAAGSPGLVDMSVSKQTPKPPVVHQLLPYPPTNFKITDVTKNSTGTPLGSCTVKLFDTLTDTKQSTVISGADGSYTLLGLGQDKTYYTVSYKAGSPDVAGTSVNTLMGS